MKRALVFRALRFLGVVGALVGLAALLKYAPGVPAFAVLALVVWYALYLVWRIVE